jgi:hypothetical protein
LHVADNTEHSYSKPEQYSLVTVPLPKLRDNDILVCYPNPEIGELDCGVAANNRHRLRSRHVEVRLDIAVLKKTIAHLSNSLRY